MNNIVIDREWKFVVFEFHNERPNGKNLLKREMLLILQIILTKISKLEQKNINFLKDIYNQTKEKYISLKK